MTEQPRPPQTFTAAASSLRILIVEDDPAYVEFLRGIFQASGMGRIQLDTVTRLDAILPTLARLDVHAMLLDLGLPDGNGLKWLEANGADLRVPVIVLTAYDGETIAVEALAAGAQDFLVKSRLEPEQLTRAVRYSLERKRTDETLRHREEQLRQAQKMEAVGRLAGGIAHDFSNLLTVIIGASERLLDRVAVEPYLRPDAETIRINCERAAGLTRQLLAFSRKQVLAPRPVDLRGLVASTGRLLTQLIGEHIFLVIDAAPDLWAVSADPVQLEQVVMNLALNARDAMPVGGSLVLRLKNVTVDADRDRDQEDILSGDYVVLEVIDTGHGMGHEVVEHAFEPFFTTKDPQKGTGLGLATVYGIVKQSGGAIVIDSAPGRGTVVRVYLPRTGEPVPETVPLDAAIKDRPAGGTETVLLTEDEAGVRELVQAVLEASGYRVLSSSGVTDAVAVAEDWKGAIDVLVSDIVMPGGTGLDLARRLKSVRPDMKVLFISGYPEHDGPALELSKGVAFLAKPFTRRMLLQKVREVLE